MIYFVFKDQQEINKGDKVKVLVKESLGSKQEILEEFILNEFFYDSTTNLLALISPKNFSKKELIEKVNNKDIIIQIEKNVS
jgi:hypothetical protein